MLALASHPSVGRNALAMRDNDSWRPERTIEARGLCDAELARSLGSRARRLVDDLWNGVHTGLHSDFREDLRQAALAQVWTALSRTQGRTDPARAAYCHTCMRHAVFHLLKRELAGTAGIVPIGAMDAETAGFLTRNTERTASEWDSLRSDGALDEDLRERLRAALLRLTPPQQQVVQLYYVRGLTDAAIAESLGKTA